MNIVKGDKNLFQRYMNMTDHFTYMIEQRVTIKVRTHRTLKIVSHSYGYNVMFMYAEHSCYYKLIENWYIV